MTESRTEPSGYELLYHPPRRQPRPLRPPGEVPSALAQVLRHRVTASFEITYRRGVTRTTTVGPPIEDDPFFPERCR